MGLKPEANDRFELFSHHSSKKEDLFLFEILVLSVMNVFFCQKNEPGIVIRFKCFLNETKDEIEICSR